MDDGGVNRGEKELEKRRLYRAKRSDEVNHMIECVPSRYWSMKWANRVTCPPFRVDVDFFNGSKAPVHSPEVITNMAMIKGAIDVNTFRAEGYLGLNPEPPAHPGQQWRYEVESVSDDMKKKIVLIPVSIWDVEAYESTSECLALTPEEKFNCLIDQPNKLWRTFTMKGSNCNVTSCTNLHAN